MYAQTSTTDLLDYASQRIDGRKRVIFDLPNGAPQERDDGIHRARHPHFAEITLYETPVPGSDRFRLHERYLSGTQLNQIDKCETLYKFQYRDGLRSPTGTRMILGIASHEYLHWALHPRYLTYQRTNSFVGSSKISDDTLATAKAAAHAKLDTQLAENKDAVIFEPRWDKGPASTVDSLHEDLDLFIDLMRTELLPTTWPMALEAAILLRWSDPHTRPFFGMLDVLAMNGNLQPYILDLKTGARSKSGDDVAYDLKMIGYASAARIATGLDIRTIQYANLLRHKDGPQLKQIPVPFEPKSVIRLYHTCAAVSRQLDADDGFGGKGIFKLRNSKMACPGCPFFSQCNDAYGPIVAIGDDETTA